MAKSADDLNEDTSASAEVNIEDNAELTALPDSQNLPVADIAIAVSGNTVYSDDPEHGSERNEEVMELLREPKPFDSEDPEIQTVLETVDEDPVVTSVSTPADDLIAAAIIPAPESVRVEYIDYGPELKTIQESLQESLATTQSLSAKIDEVSKNTDGFVKQLNGLSLNYELLTAEMETISSDSHAKSFLSKTFLIISSVIIALLVIFQIYMFTSLIKTERLQNAAGSSVMENITSLNKKMAAYDKNLTKALESAPSQEHAQPHPVAVENGGHEVAAHKEADAVNVTPVLEKLNKLRNGLPEKKLVRKETGDWFVYGKKNEECISDVEVVESLNQAYRKIGRTTSPGFPMPAHNALCILKPDGKGGTQVVMTKDFMP